MTTKVVQRKIIHDTGQTLTCMHFPQLVWPMHCHDTCELIIMTAGSGREYIGHAVAPYRSGDITLIGRDIPHLHLCDSLDGNPDTPASTCEILYFSPALFPDNIAAIPEYAAIASMLEKSACGLRFRTNGETAHILDKIRQLACANGIARIRILLDILDTLAQIPASTIAPEPVDKKRLHKQLTVIDKVMQYLKTRYREPLTLATIAAHTGMNPSALCRHFRRHTGKTLTAVLNEIRIAHACQQLYTTNRSISAIAWESGFASQTHFNRQFRTLTGQTPGQYRKNSRSDVTAYRNRTGKPFPSKKTPSRYRMRHTLSHACGIKERRMKDERNIMLYAHSLPDQPPEKWQSLSEHLLAVAELAAQMADVFHASPLAFIIGYLHDLGKASEEGQKRIHGTGPRVDHSTAGARELIERWERQYGERCKVLAECLSYCITGHHSGLADYGEHDLDTGTLRNRLSNKRSIPDYKTGMQELRVPELEPRPVPFRVNGFSLAFFIRMLFSCLTDADWLDTEAFCNPERADKRKKDWPDIETLATRLMQTFCQREWLGKKEDRTVWPSDSVNEISRAQGIIRARKAILARSIEAAEQSPGLFSLTVPTGGGKTASSMAFALEHARRHGLRRVILVVPYTSIIEQNARELREWLGDDAVLEHHSQYIHPAERRQENKGGQTDDDQPDALQAQQFRMATENWDATVIVTTAVQFFESLFAASPQRCRKLHNIARSVIIFDEAQMIPVSLLKPSVLAMKELAFHYGCSLLFCTATQPALNRDGQNDEFPGFEPGSVTEIIPAERLLSLFSLFSRVKRTQLGKISDTELAKNLKSEKQVLCIVNTRARAQEVFEACCGPDDTDSWFHLSARMTPAHRIQVLEKCIRERLRKEQTCHVVSTSLIECGVDISFPALYREQSGLDSVAQAAGRCNRHGELPEGGRFYVFKPECGLPKRAHDLQRRATLFDSVICQYDDPFTPEAVASYFSQLRSYANTDESDVLRTLCDGNTGTAQGYRFNFRSADRAYRFIDTDMIPVIVENDIERSDAAELVRKLERYEDDPLLFRRLQQHTVQIYPWEVETLERHGALECIRERFYVLRNGTGYDRQLGLVVNDPTHMDAEKGIF